MKTRLLGASLALLFAANLLATPGLAQSPQKVTLALKNNGWRPREFRFLERHPADKLFNVFTAYLLPGQSYRAELKVGTALAQVTQPEINAVMQGQTVAGQPLLVVRAADNGRTVNLVTNSAGKQEPARPQTGLTAAPKN